jgi:hypothetical protein
LFCAGLSAEARAADVHGSGVDPIAATPVQREQAQSRFLRGKELYERGELIAALAEFDASRAIVASPNARLYRARCLRDLNQVIEAYNEFGQTSVEALELAKWEARYERTAEAASVERRALSAKLAFVHLTILHSRAETTVSVNNERIRRTAWSEPVPALAGRVEVLVQSPGVLPQRRELNLKVGTSTDVTIDLGAFYVIPPASGAQLKPPRAPTPIYPSKHRTSLKPYAYTAAGVGVLGVGTFTAFGLMSNHNFEQLEASCPSGRCSEEALKRADEGKNQQLVANLGLALGVIGLSGAVTLFVLDDDLSDEYDGVEVAVSHNRILLRGKL